MHVWILAFHLLHGQPVQRVRVESCEAGRVWLQQAWAWSYRSGLGPIGPVYVCYEER